MKAAPTARPRSLITGKQMDKIVWGPNWEEILGGEFAEASQGPELRRHPEGHLRPVREHVHDVPAAAVRALPQSVVRRELPVGLDLQARGRRHRADRPGQVPRLAHVRERLPVQVRLRLVPVSSSPSDSIPDTFFDLIEGRATQLLFRGAHHLHPAGRAARRRGHPETSSVRFGICGAAPASEELLSWFEARYGFPLIEGYGL